MKSGLENHPKDLFYYKKEQTFWGLNGFVLEDTPVSRGSCWAFCRQNCFRSAAAWETFTRLSPASSRSCWTTFFIAATLEEPDMALSGAGQIFVRAWVCPFVGPRGQTVGQRGGGRGSELCLLSFRFFAQRLHPRRACALFLRVRFQRLTLWGSGVWARVEGSEKGRSGLWASS